MPYLKCEHNKRKSRCITCGGNEICEHKKRKSICITCGGNDLYVNIIRKKKM